jgi:predicted exporter
MNKRQTIGFYAWLIISLLVLLFLLISLPNTRWSSNITSAIPSEQAAWQQQLLQQNTSSRHLSILLSGIDLASLHQAATRLQQANIQQLTWANPGMLMQQLQHLYQQYQGLIVSPEQFALLQNGQFQPLVTAAWQRLLSPAPLLDAALQQDPLLLTQQALEQHSNASPLQVRQHWLEDSQQPALLLYAQLDIDPFERDNAAVVAQQIEQQLHLLQQQWPLLEINRSGVLFHAVIASANASFEMQLFGGISLLAILLLMWSSFTSLRPILLALTTLAIASAFGLAAMLLLFSQPHVMALVFATTLIGIAIDYSIHGMLAANKGPTNFRRMLPSLLLGLVSTLLGYVALTLLPFALLGQVAVFMSAGLSAAFITVWLVFPRWLPAQSMPSSKLLVRLCQRLSDFYQGFNHNKVLISAIFAAVAILTALLSQARFSDDVRLFNQSPAELIQQQQQVLLAGGQNWDSRFIVLLADNTEQLLQQEQQLTPLLQQWQQQGELQQWQAIGQRIPAQQQQAELQRLLQLAYQSPVLQHYLQQLQLPIPAPIEKRLTVELLPAELSQQLQPLNDKVASIILLKGLVANSQMQQQLDTIANSFWLDPIADTNQSLLHIRSQLSGWLVLAFTLAIMILLWQRGWQATLAIALMLVLSLGSSLLLSQWLQQHLNIFNLIAALLILALALDYGIFFTAKLAHAAVLQAVLLSALTSCLAFGLLSFSQTPAIASFGLTVFIGVALACLLAPLLNNVNNKEK